MGYYSLSRSGNIVYRILVKISSLTFFFGAYLFVLLLLIYPLGLFSIIKQFGDPLEYFLGLIVLLLPWLFPAFVGLWIKKAVEKTQGAYIFFLATAGFWLLDGLLLWVYVLRR